MFPESPRRLRAARGLPAGALALAVWIVAAGLPAATPLTAVQQRALWNRPVPEWLEGPVRYVVTADEAREFRSLKTPAERAGFIARFWASRDPEPYVSGNPAEETFWQRVSSADELFATTTLAGWRTDRGRIYVILGPPDEISSYAAPSVSELDPTHFYDGIKRGPQHDLPLGQRGAVEWVYHSLPNPEAVAGQTVTFVKDPTGEFRLSQSLNAAFRYEVPRTDLMQMPSVPGVTPPPINPLAEANNFEDRMRSLENLASWAQGSLFEKMDPNLEPVARVSAAEFFGVIPVRHGIAFFRADGGTATLLALGIPADLAQDAAGAPAEAEIFGSLEKATGPPQSFQFSSKRQLSDSMPLQMIEGTRHVLFEVRGVVPPGTYRMNFGARIGDRAGTSGLTVVVPDFSPGALSLAGPILAEGITQVGTGESPGGFTIGKIKMIPRLGSEYAVGSDFGFYFQVYDARPGDGDARVHLDLTYSVSVREKGVFRPLGKPVALVDNAAPSHAYQVPLKGWSPGEYLLTVTVQDRVSGEIAAGTAPFRVHSGTP